jgi:hypothetical protein
LAGPTGTPAEISGIDRNVFGAAIFDYARQYEQAIQQFRVTQEMDPNFLCAHMIVDNNSPDGLPASGGR